LFSQAQAQVPQLLPMRFASDYQPYGRARIPVRGSWSTWRHLQHPTDEFAHLPECTGLWGKRRKCETN
jgi:hypothetical protein